jgi:hypothetical protein
MNKKRAQSSKFKKAQRFLAHKKQVDNFNIHRMEEITGIIDQKKLEYTLNKKSRNKCENV